MCGFGNIVWSWISNKKKDQGLRERKRERRGGADIESKRERKMRTEREVVQ